MTQVSNEMHAANSEFSSVEANANASDRVGPLSATVRDNDKDRVEELKLFLEIQNSATVNILVTIMISPCLITRRDYYLLPLIMTTKTL